MDNFFELSGKALGERLKKVRTNNKISRDELAKLFGVGRASIQNYEYGERSPSADYLVKYYRYFGTNLHWLLTGNGAAHFQELLSDENQGGLSSPREETILHLTRQLDAQSLNYLIDFLMSIQSIPNKNR